MEKTNNKKKLFVIIAIVLVVLAVAATGIYFLLTAEKVTFYEPKVELGDEKYLEQLTANVYVKEGYGFEVKDNKIDIMTAGTYTLTLEVKGKGKTTEEVKEIQVVDTTPPTLELSKTEFYIGDTVNLEEVLVIKDLSAKEAIPYAEAKVQAEGVFDTSKEGTSTVKVSATDINGNVGTADVTIKIKNPIMTVYDYMVQCFAKKRNGFYKYEFDKYSSDIGITYTHTYGSGYFNFTEKVCKSANKYSYFSYIDFIYFNNSLNVTKISEATSYNTKVKTVSLKSDSGKATIDVFDGQIEDIFDEILGDKGRKIKLTGKTMADIKKETIDLRTLAQ